MDAINIVQAADEVSDQLESRAFERAICSYSRMIPSAARAILFIELHCRHVPTLTTLGINPVASVKLVRGVQRFAERARRYNNFNNRREIFLIHYRAVLAFVTPHIFIPAKDLRLPNRSPPWHNAKKWEISCSTRPH